MISARELYYLNGALDGERIYGINPIQNLIENVEDNRSPKETLMEKNILEDGEVLNENSFEMIENLEQYKEAKTYVRINGMSVSIDGSKYLIYLKKDSNGEFILGKVLKSLMICSIINDYPFLAINKPTEENKEKIKIEDIIVDKILMKENGEWFYIKKERDEEPYIYNIYYKEKEKIYKYNALTEELISINPKDIRMELMEIFEVGVK